MTFACLIFSACAAYLVIGASMAWAHWPDLFHVLGYRRWRGARAARAAIIIALGWPFLLLVSIVEDVEARRRGRRK